MQDKVFIDTNIIIYSYSKDEPSKRTTALELLGRYDERAIISKQVINELANILSKKFKLCSSEIESVLLELDTEFNIVDFDLSTQIKAIKLKDSYNLQFYDALIIATALENRCAIVYSEDMQDGLIVDEKIKIINPFNV
jgi:predicted nucleic acid-binding protein